jgi:L-seryl-tRNA(Ser) seleniumtransferase
MDKPAPRSLRDLPSVDLVLKTRAASALQIRFGRASLVDAIRAELVQARAAFRAGGSRPSGAEEIAALVSVRLDAADRPSLRPVFNLTGTVLHTNLGRAVLADAAVQAAVSAMREPVTLEFDLGSAGAVSATIM